MKVFAIPVRAIFFVALVFSPFLFVSNASADAQIAQNTPVVATPKKAVKLPPTITIKAADVDMTTTLVDSNMNNAKAQGQAIGQDSATISKLLPQLEQSISVYRNKVNVCKSKTYTTEDQKKAGCKDDMTIAQCSQKLFSSCIFAEANLILKWSNQLDAAAKKAETNAKNLRKSVDYINNHASTRH